MSLIATCFCSWMYGKLKVLIDCQSITFWKMSWGWKYLEAGLVPPCLRTGHVSRPDLSWLVLGPDMYRGWKFLRARLVSRFRAGDVQGRKCLAAGLDLRPEVSWSYLVVKITKFWLSKSIFYVKNRSINPRFDSEVAKILKWYLLILHTGLISSDSIQITTLTTCITLKIQPFWLWKVILSLLYMSNQ